jgi:hypothetical protein
VEHHDPHSASADDGFNRVGMLDQSFGIIVFGSMS